MDVFGSLSRWLWLSGVFACSLVSASTASGQDFEETGLAEDHNVYRLSNVRKGPSKRSARIGTIEAGATVRLLKATPRNGYVRVLFGNGEQGFVWGENVGRPETAPALRSETLLTAAASPQPCAADFTGCEPRGCYDAGSNGALFNEAKRRTPIGSLPVTIDFNDLKFMQEEIGRRLGGRSQNNALTAAERQQLQNIAVDSGTVGESILVRIAGYIPADGTGLKKGSVETVNCRFDEVDERDIHIPLARLSSFTEFQGIVIEMIPQGRPAGWTLAKLRLVRDRKRKVLVDGGLFYDNEHAVNNIPSQPLGGHSKRFTIWELHPVTRFFVCTRATNSCRISSPGGWVPLEDYQ